MSSITTFRRKARGAGTAADSSADSAPASASCGSETYVTAASVLTPVPESPEEQDENAGPGASVTKPARWRGKNAAARQSADRRQYLSEMRAHFEEVDAFELAVETPPAIRAEAPSLQRSPPCQQPGVAQALAAAAPTPGTAVRQRPMSLGLSRRRSSLAPWATHTALASSSKAAHSPLKPAVPPGAADGHREGGDGMDAMRRSTLLPAGQHRLSVAADNAGASPGWAVNRPSLGTQGRRSAVAPSRLSSNNGQVLSRLSVGLTDALQWLGIKKKMPTAAAAAAAAAAEGGLGVAAATPDEADGSGGFAPLARPALSPIASPGLDEEATSPAELSPVTKQPLLAAPGALPAATVHAAAAEEDEEAEPTAMSVARPAGNQLHAAPAAPRVEEAAEEQQDIRQLEEQLAASLHLHDAEQEAAEDLTPLQQLLMLCGQETDVELLPSMDELLGQHVDLKKVRKIGEGTFGEAFEAGGVVLKLVPMEGEVLVNGEPQKRTDEILAEVSVTLTLSRLNGSAAEPGAAPDNMTTGFVETYGVGVCRGAYSAALRREWHRWDKENGSENEEVDIFGGDQLFVVFVVANGGADLEHFQLRSFEEVRSILLQTVLAVAVAEEACEFEHRDLHWGNLLIRRSEEPAASTAVCARLRGIQLEAATDGVTVCLIDFTLSRLVTVTGEVAFCNLAADPELFTGPKGSVQAETYRRMKKVTKNKWEAHVPATNVFWMQYLVDICMTEKKGWSCRKEQVSELRAFKRRVLTYPSCAELLFDDFLRPGLVMGDA